MEEWANAIVNPVNPMYIRDGGKGMFDPMENPHPSTKQNVVPINATANAGKND